MRTVGILRGVQAIYICTNRKPTMGTQGVDILTPLCAHMPDRSAVLSPCVVTSVLSFVHTPADKEQQTPYISLWAFYTFAPQAICHTKLTQKLFAGQSLPAVTLPLGPKVQTSGAAYLNQRSRQCKEEKLLVPSALRSPPRPLASQQLPKLPQLLLPPQGPDLGDMRGTSTSGQTPKA